MEKIKKKYSDWSWSKVACVNMQVGLVTLSAILVTVISYILAITLTSNIATLSIVCLMIFSIGVNLMLNTHFERLRKDIEDRKDHRRDCEWSYDRGYDDGRWKGRDEGRIAELKQWRSFSDEQVISAIETLRNEGPEALL